MPLPGLTKEQMVEVSRIMVKELHVPVELMMEHSGLNLARLATRFSGVKPIEYLIVAGCRQLPQTWTIMDIFEFDFIYSSRETSS